MVILKMIYLFAGTERGIYQVWVFTKAISRIKTRMEMEELIIPTATFMKDGSEMVKSMEWANSQWQLELCKKACGLVID